METRSLSLSDCDLKFVNEGKGQFEGYLSIFNSVDSYGDTIIPGAFKETLSSRKRMPPMLLNHDGFSEIPIGVWKSMKEDDAGLRVVGELTPGNSKSEQVYAAMKHGALDGLSIGYRKSLFEENDHGGFDLHKIDLREGSIVSMPAEDAARIDKVKFDAIEEIASWKDVEYALRDVGLSQSAAKMLISHVKSFCQRDADELIAKIGQLETQLGEKRANDLRSAQLQRIQQLVRG